MTIELTDDMRDIIREQLATGLYATETEVLRSALKKLQRAWELHQDIIASMEDEAAGRLIDLDELDAEFRATYKLPQQA